MTLTAKHFSPGILVRGAMALALAATLTTAATEPAQAYSGNGSGRPGAMNLTPVQGSAYLATYAWVPWLKVDGMTAERSSATTGAQTVSATFRVFRWSGTAWAYETGNTVATTIAAGAVRAAIPAYNTFPTRFGYFHVEATFTWKSGTTTLGTMNVFWSQASDYRCQTFTKCSTGPGWVYLG